MKIKTKSKKVNKSWLNDHVNDPYVKLAQKEGFQKGTRSYRTNNPGNIGNTDSGGDKTLKNLEAGIKLQLDYIKKVAKGEHTSYPLNNTYFSIKFNDDRF